MTRAGADTRDPGDKAPGPRPLWTRAVTVLMAAVVLSAATLSMLTAAERPRLDGITPADGAVVGQTPSAVVLTFSGAFQPREVHVSVGDASGRIVGDRPRSETSTVSVPVQIGADGVYLVAYHIVLADGQVLAGQADFRVTAGAADSAGSSVPALVAGGHVHGSEDPLNLALALLAVLLIGAMVTLLIWRPRPRT